MKGLVDEEGKKLKQEKDKVEGLIRDHSEWEAKGRKLKKKEEQEDTKEQRERNGKKMGKEVWEAQRKTCNTLVSKPDGISYRFIKTLKDTKTLKH